MNETPQELEELQQLLDRSRATSTEHLRGIIRDERALTAAQLVQLLSSMKVLSLATTTAGCAPRISAVDGHFLHGSWTFSTSGTSAKARHMAARPQVSVAHIDHESFAVFSHGAAVHLVEEHPRYDEALGHLTAHYGSSPLSWGDDVRLYQLEPTWMVGFAMDPSKLLDERT